MRISKLKNYKNALTLGGVNKKEIIKKTADFVKNKLSGEGTGHDWWHTYRVWRVAGEIMKKEKGADLFVVELAALLHDIADWKFYNGDDSVGPKVAAAWLKKVKVSEGIISQVASIIKNLSFKGAGVKSKINTKEGMIVQDADRLDALGAVGIARTFAYGGAKGREIYNPEIRPVKHKNFEQYKKSQGTSLNHFYEKLFLLKNLMNTKAGKEIAMARHKFTAEYVKEFLEEWGGKDYK